ncbi:MAG TPA: hypothetical protein VFA83_22510 [Acidimicrobiales bacterium]|nr:hypothetical protein [Acidimicrobiales bacterium]
MPDIDEPREATGPSRLFIAMIVLVIGATAAIVVVASGDGGSRLRRGEGDGGSPAEVKTTVDAQFGSTAITTPPAKT